MRTRAHIQTSKSVSVCLCVPHSWPKNVTDRLHHTIYTMSAINEFIHDGPCVIMSHAMHHTQVFDFLTHFSSAILTLARIAFLLLFNLIFCFLATLNSDGIKLQ